MTRWDAPLEKDIEAFFVRKCQAQGWRAEKFTSPARRSVPDRIVSKNDGTVFFAELKAPGKKPTAKQLDDHKRRQDMGFRVYVVSTTDEATDVVSMESML